MVASDVAEVTVTAETTDSGASIDYLDGDDATLDDADTGVDGHQVTLAVGDNVIKVKVTAEDTNHRDLHGDGEPGGPDLHAEHRRPLVRGRHGGGGRLIRVWTVGYGFTSNVQVPCPTPRSVSDRTITRLMLFILERAAPPAS